MDGAILLCDAAEAVEGKLYMLGGAWSVLAAADRPVSFSVAVVLTLDESELTGQHALRIAVFGADGEPVASDGRRVATEVGFTLERPAGAAPGAVFNLPFTWALNGIALDAGAYRVGAAVDGEQVAVTRFSVEAPA